MRPRQETQGLFRRARRRSSGALASWLAHLVWRDAPASFAGTVVVCHEWLVTIGGSDKVAAELADAIDADYVAVLAARPELVERLAIKAEVIECRLGRFVRHGQRWAMLLPLMPVLWSALDLRTCRLVVTSSHAFVNFVRAPRDAKLSYCHTPMRYAWDWQLEAGRIPRLLRSVWPVTAGLLRRLDRLASTSVTRFVSNSANVQSRIAKCYGRDATVVHPPIDLDWWTASPGERRDFVLVAGRMVAYKHPEMAVRAARLAGRPVVVAGSGPALDGVELGNDVVFVADPTDEQLRGLYRQCLLLAFPAIEDFGMIPLEAQACGAPVVGVRAGGTIETVHHGESGLLVERQTAEALSTAIREIADAPFEVLPWVTERYGRGRFACEIRRVVADMGVV
jgi:glycosyltransferase involved in cell wall biosynthesis